MPLPTTKLGVRPEFRNRPFLVGSLAANTNPYAGLEIPSGINHSSRTVREIAAATIEAQGDAASITGVANWNEVERDPQRLVGALCDQAERRVGSRGYFLILDHIGERAYEGVPALVRQLGLLPLIKDVTPKHLNERDQVLWRPQQIIDAHNALLASLLDLQRGGLLLDSDSGVDLGRIRTLAAIAKRHEADFLTHDLLPAAARNVHLTEHVPYLVIPRFPQFFSSAFSTLEQPCVLSMRNFLSHASFSEVLEAFNVAAQLGKSGASRIVFSQSVGLAETNNLFPIGLRPTTSELKGSVLEIISDMIRVDKWVPGVDTSVFTCAILFDQAVRTYSTLMFELALASYRKMAQSQGYNFHTRVSASSECVLKPSTVEQFFERRGNFRREAFDSGTFNTIVIGPFQENLLKDETVEAGNLKLISKELHLIFSKSPNKALSISDSIDRLRWITSSDWHYLSEPTDRFSDPVSALLFAGEHGAAPGGASPEWYQKVQRLGAKIGVCLLFDYTFRLVNHPIGHFLDLKAERIRATEKFSNAEG